MIESDRRLLARLRRVNGGLGEVALALMAGQNGGELPARGLREVGEALCALGTDMLARADEINPQPALTGGRETPHALLTRSQWHTLTDTLADMCRAMDGMREDLHDRAAGILEAARPAEWAPVVEDGPARELWCHAYEVIGALAHLADAAPHDTRHLHAVGRHVAELAHHLLTHQDTVDV